MVGRETEMRRLCETPSARRSRPLCQLFTILGSAGVGKSRLVAEFLGSLDGAAGRARPVSALRGRHHLLAGGRGAQAAPAGGDRPGRRRDDSRPGRRRGAGLVRRRDRLGVPQAARGRRRRDAGRLRLRRRALGRGDVPGSDRARRRPLPRRADPAALHGPPGAPRPPDGLGRRQGQRDQRAARAARPGGDRAADREPRPPRRRPARTDPRCGRGQPALRRGDGRVRGGVGRRRDHRAADDPGAAGRPPRPARCARAGRARAAARSRAASSTAAPSRRWRPRSRR